MIPADKKILLVDDEEPLRNLTADVLTESGYTVLSARDGIQALEIARSYKETIHLLLTDLAMPRLGGPALARYMAHLRPETRVLFMTGHAERETTSQQALPTGIEALQKPFNKDILVRRVRQALDARPQSASSESGDVAVVVP